jgi:hypothetical protein
MGSVRTKLLLSSLLVLCLGATSTQSAIAAQPVSGISTTAYNEGSDQAAVFYNPIVVSNVNLTLPQSSVDTLNNDPYTSVYQTANVAITTADGKVTTLNNIGVRLKGQATRTNLYGKAPMKLKFDAFVPGQKFLGLTRMTLNSMVQDPSFIREDTSYRIYRAMGLVAPRTTYSWVTLNNADFGLYMNVESIDAQMLKRWLNPVHVYSSNCYLADLTYYQSGCFDTNYGDSDRTDLNAAIAVSVLNGQEWWTAVNKIADMTAVINLMATDIYTSNWDGYTDVVQNNYYIVFDDTGRLKIIPWGQDGTFPMQEDAQLDWLGRGPAFRNFGNQERSVMLRKCVAYTPCQAQLVRAQVAVKNKVATLDISGFKNKVASVINNAYISKETRSNSDVWSAIFWQDWLDTFFPQRTQALTAFLNTRSPEAPTLSMNGPSTVGSTLKAVASTWDYTATLSYQWLKNSQPIANATGTDYLITSADANSLISVRVSSTKRTLPTASATSVAVLVTNPQLPSASITGDARVGGTLIGNPIANGSNTVSYKWYRDGKLISAATGATYTPTSADLQKSISLVTSVTQVGFPLVVSSSSSRVIGLGLISKPAVVLAGKAATGNTLLINAEIPFGSKATYQWLRDSQVITGASRAEYKVKPEDLNSLLTAKINLTRTAYTPTSVTSDGVRVVTGEMTKSPTPTISGVASLNKTLSGQVGSWDTGVKFTYQWLRNDVEIPGAVAKTYRVSSLDKGKQLVFRIRATKDGYKTLVLSSNSIAAN